MTVIGRSGLSLRGRRAALEMRRDQRSITLELELADEHFTLVLQPRVCDQFAGPTLGSSDSQLARIARPDEHRFRRDRLHQAVLHAGDSAARGLNGRLAFTGVREDVQRLLSATDVYVKPGIVEGFIGITVLEALALGKPVVAFETADVKLALTDGETGLIVANADVDQLADRILYLLRNPDVGQRLGQAGQQVVLERFDFGVLARRLEEFYQGVLDRPAALTP